MARAGVACDLCELGRDLAWIIRTHTFTVGLGEEDGDNFDVIQTFDEDEEWGLCSACWRDMQADNQEGIFRRRRQALVLDTPAEEWAALDDQQRGAIFQVMEMTIMAVMSCRVNGWGRAWTRLDGQQAVSKIAADGQRGKRP
jgi:hypothetical protein